MCALQALGARQEYTLEKSGNHYVCTHDGYELQVSGGQAVCTSACSTITSLDAM